MGRGVFHFWKFTLLLPALLAAASLAGAQSTVRFFSPLTSYQQTKVTNAQGLVANSAGNLYVSGTTALAYVPVDGYGNPILASQQSITSISSSDVLGMAIDSSNNLFRVDPVGNTVQYYQYGGSVTTFTSSSIGSGWSKPSSVAVDSSSNVYVLDAGLNAIVKLAPDGSGGFTQSTVFTNALLANTSGLSIDSSGNFYLTSGPSNGAAYTLSGSAVAAVYKVTNNSGSYSIATIGSGWTSPTATAVDSYGNVWVADYSANEVVLLAWDGSAYTQYNYQSVSKIRTLMVNASGELYGFGYGASQAVIWAGGTAPHNMGTVNVGGTASTATVTVQFTAAKTLGTVAVTTQGNTAGDFTVSSNRCTAGSYVVGDTCNVVVSFAPQYPGLRKGALVIYDSSGNVLGTNYLYGTGEAPQLAYNNGTTASTFLSGLPSVYSLAVDGNGNFFLGTNDSPTIPEYNATSAQVVYLGGANTSATGVAVDGAGNVFVADNYRNVIHELQRKSDGSFNEIGATTLYGNPNDYHPVSLAVDATGNLFYTSYDTDSLVEAINNNGTYTTTALATGLSTPQGIAVDASGNVYVADTGNNQVLKYTLSGGTYTKSVISGEVNTPMALFVDLNGNVYVADSGNNRVVVLQYSGGSYTQSVALAAGQLTTPSGIVQDSLGNLFISGLSDGKIVKLTRSTTSAHSFANTLKGNTSSDSPQYVSLLNIGNVALDFAAQTSTTNPYVGTSSFAVDSSSSTCAVASVGGSDVTLAANGSCLVGVDFTPASIGSLSDSLTLIDNTLYGSAQTQTVALSGTGFADVSQLVFTASPTTSVSAGSAAATSITVTEKDSSNSVVTLASDTITLTVTGPNSYSQSYTAAASSGVATFSTAASATLTAAGGYTYTASVAGNSTITTATANQTVTATTAATVASTSGSGQDAKIGAAFSAPLQVTVTDSYGNPVSGASVTFSAPTSTAGATFATSPATTNASGVASVTATANAYAGSYNVTAAVSGATSGTFSLTNDKATPTIGVNPTPASPTTYGQAVTFNTTVSYSVGTPGGTVTFLDGSTTLGTGTLSGGAASLSSKVYFTAGSHNPTVNYGGDANFSATGANGGYTVNQAPVTITAASGQTAAALSTTSTLAMTLTGAYTGTGILVPGAAGSSTVTCNFYNSSSTLVASNSATVVPGTTSSSAACTVPSAVTATQGSYTVTAVFNGDANYSASSTSSSAGGSGNSLNFGFSVQAVTPTITWSPASSLTSVAYGTTASAVLTAAATYNSSSVTGSYVYSTTVSSSTVTVSSATILPAGSYTLKVTFTPTSPNYSTATQTISYTVTQATPAITLSSGSNPTWIGNSVTYTATVVGVSGGVAPTGTVTFYDGATALGTASLSSGVATLSAVPATTGTHSVTAVVAADANYVTKTSSAVSEVAVDFTIAVSSSGSSSASVVPGGTATYTLVVTPVGSTTFPGAITLSATGQPTSATVSFSTSPIALGATAATETMTVATSATQLVSNEGFGRRMAPLSLALLLLPLAGLRRARKLLSRSLMVVLLLLGGLAATATLTGCSLPSGYFGQTAKTFTITVAGNNGSFTHTTSVTLTVQ